MHIKKLLDFILRRKPRLLAALFIVALILVGPAQTVTSTNVIVNSYATIIYTPPSTSSNLAPIVSPAIKGVVGGYWGLIFGEVPQYAFLDETVTRNGHPSIRVEPDPSHYREVDGTILRVKPGDHIVAKVWIKTTSSSLGDTDVRDGGRFGMDLYARTSAGYGQVDWHPTDAETWTFAVPWGTPTWTQKSWDIIVPSTYYTKVYFGPGSYISCNPVQIDSFVLWLDARDYEDAGLAWFADAELYINP